MRLSFRSPAPDAPPPSPAVLGQLAGGAAAVTLGAFPILAGLGLMETEGGIEPFARVVAVLFGAVFVTLGGSLIAIPMRAVARAHGAATPRDAVRLGLRRLRGRPTAGSAGAALWTLILAAGCWLAVAGVPLAWLGGARGLRALVIIEFLVIHGFPFLVLVAGIAGHARGRLRLAAGGFLAFLLLLYGALAWKVAEGVGGVLALLYLMVPSLQPFAVEDAPVGTRILIGSRWVIKTALMLLMLGILGGGSLEAPEAVRVGAGYFTLLAAAEMFRVVEIPGELATAA